MCAAGNQEHHQRKLRFGRNDVAGAVYPGRVQMPLQVVHPHQRQPGSQGESFRRVQADYQGAREPGPRVTAMASRSWKVR